MRCGYVNPDEKTCEYLKDRPYTKSDKPWDEVCAEWLSWASDSDTEYDDVVNIRAEDIAPTVTWGISPDQGFSIAGTVPKPEDAESEAERGSVEEALAYMKLEPGSPIKGTKIDVAFIGS